MNPSKQSSKSLKFPSESLRYAGILILPQYPFSQHHSVFFYETYVKVWNGLHNIYFSYPEWESHYSKLMIGDGASLTITQNFVSAALADTKGKISLEKETE